MKVVDKDHSTSHLIVTFTLVVQIQITRPCRVVVVHTWYEYEIHWARVDVEMLG